MPESVVPRAPLAVMPSATETENGEIRTLAPGWEATSFLSRDRANVVVGVTLFVASVYVLANLLVNLAFGRIDPRLRSVAR